MGSKKDKKKRKKKHKKEKKKKHVTSSSESESEKSSSDGEEVWVEKKPSNVSSSVTQTSEKFMTEMNPKCEVRKQDAFDLFFSEASKSRKDLREAKNFNSEDCGQTKNKELESELESTITSRELNPYWKSGDKGLPRKETDEESRTLKIDNIDKNIAQTETDFDPVDKIELSSQSKIENKNDKVEEAPVVNLNKLSAALLKAELMGDSAKVEKLRQEIETAKQSESSKKTEVLLMKTSASGSSYPVGRSESNNFGSHKRKGKIETHDKDGKRVRYSADEDGQSVHHLMMKERSQTAANQNAALMKLMGRSGARGFESLDDMFVSAKAQKKTGNVENELLERAAKEEQKKALQTLDECYLCFNSPACKQRLVIKSEQYSYISLPFDSPLVDNHCLISPVLHYTCSTLLDEEVYEEIESQKRFLVDKFSTVRRRVIFVECFRSSNKFFHMSIECIPVRKSAFSEAPMFFKKAIMESEEEWSMNKKLVDLKNNDVRKTIPKGLSYFTVQFGMEKGGFAHVIEDCRLFPRYFARQVLGGMLDLDDFLIHKPKPLTMERQLENVKKFKSEVLDTK